MENKTMDIRQAIKYIMRKNKVTQEQIASVTGETRESISQKTNKDIRISLLITILIKCGYSLYIENESEKIKII